MYEAIKIAETDVDEKKQIIEGNNDFANEILNSDGLKPEADSKIRIRLLEELRRELKANEGEERFILDELIANEEQIGKYFHQYVSEHAGQKLVPRRSTQGTGRTELRKKRKSLRVRTRDDYLRLDALDRALKSSNPRLDVVPLRMKKARMRKR